MSISTRVSELAIAIRSKINEMVPRLLPRGGQMGQVLAKSSGNDFAVSWIDSSVSWASRSGWSPVKAIGTGSSQEIILPEDRLVLGDIIVFVEGIFQHSGYSISGNKLITTQPQDFEIVIVPRGTSSTGSANSSIRPIETLQWSPPSAEMIWVIPHSFGRYPRVLTTDSLGREFEGSVSYPDINTVIVEFAFPISGTAYLE